MPDFRTLVQAHLAPLHLEPSAEAGLVEELSQHLADVYADLIGRGVSAAEAWRQTSSQLKDVAKDYRQVPVRRLPAIEARSEAKRHRGRILTDQLMNDVQYSLRTVRNNPLFALFVVLSLGLGIGANTTVFTVLNTLILNPVPVHRPSELVGIATVESAKTSAATSTLPMSLANLQDYAARNQVFESMAAYTAPRIVTMEQNGVPQRLFAEMVTGDYFRTLGLQPAKGRFFARSEDVTPGAHPVAVMNYATCNRGSEATMGSSAA